MAYLDKNVKITAQVESTPSAAIFWLIIAKLLIEIVEIFFGFVPIAYMGKLIII